MILIIGGAYQGKTEYAENLGNKYKIINRYHLRVKEQLMTGQNPIDEAERLMNNADNCEESGSELIIISDEVGYGLVPVDKLEREYREQSGRVNCYFADKARQVIRVVCGIGTRIK